VELDATPPGDLEVIIDEAKDEVSDRVAEVHAILAEMEAETSPFSPGNCDVGVMRYNICNPS
jgi:hypothetical protein